jgi:hypothetical protein
MSIKASPQFIAPLPADPFGAAMRAACVRPGEPLSNRPLIVRALNSEYWLSAEVAYWPADEETGRRVYDALQAEDGQHTAFDGDSTIHLIRAFMSFDTHSKRLCKLLSVPSLAKLGVMRHVSTRDARYCVDVEKLDVCLLRLDVQY